MEFSMIVIKMIIFIFSTPPLSKIADKNSEN